MPPHVLEWLRQFPDSRLVVNINGNGFVTLWNKERSIDDMLAEREAQVREQEREAAKGLVEALEHIKHNSAESVADRWLDNHKDTAGCSDKAIMAWAYRDLRRRVEALATYREKSGEEV